MRIQAKKPILLGKDIRWQKTTLKVPPIVAASEQELEKQTKSLEFSPDIIEWRVDSFEGAKDVTRVVKALKGLKTTNQRHSPDFYLQKL